MPAGFLPTRSAGAGEGANKPQEFPIGAPAVTSAPEHTSAVLFTTLQIQNKLSP